MDGPTLPAAMMTLPAAPGVARPREPQLQSSMNQPWLRFTKRTHTTARRTRGSPKLDRTKAKRVYCVFTAAYSRAHAPLARAYRSLAGLLMHRWVLYFERKLAGVRGSVLVA